MKMPLVINAGIGGNNTRDLLARLDADVLTHRPSLVCLLVGANDLLNSRNPVPLAEYQQNIRALSERICKEEAGAALLLLTILPCYEKSLLLRHDSAFFAGMSPNACVRAANAFLHAYSNEQGLPIADLYGAFSAHGELGEDAGSLIRNLANAGVADGVHPTTEGYCLIAALVFDAIQRHALPADKVVCFGDSITRGVHMPGEGTAQGDTYPAWLAKSLVHAVGLF